MATTSAVLAPVTVTGAAVSCGSRKTRQATKPRVVYIGGMSSYSGLKAHNNIVSLGQPVCTEQSFANFVNSLKARGKGRRGGGALSATCNAVGEIFRIAAIMNGLVLVGVAVGFVLLRVEAYVEESEAE
ncbi:PetM of cytochrome b6/f complex subunit 7 [Corchorus olitorius]|uniref:PetM of cytochrome b6/f complex subunit 7 n=1 Tax=Corchorus olitorius TaxID=93759 RepID=A0A1R3HXC7_9ROSI|nr:PetM of cytochrome b6/f complex subunit 7 [Corchorus olitorius]